MASLILSPKKIYSWVAIGIVVLIFCGPGFAQGNFGRILGGVTDPTGAVIPGATVTVTDVQRGISRTLTADQGGQYAAPNLLPGTYTVRAEAKGFRTTERSGLLLQVGQDLRIDFSLQVGEEAQTVTVTGEAPLVEVTNATLGGSLSNEIINNLPLMGRNYQNLVVLRPGSLWYPGGGGWTQSTNGSRPEDNGYIIDGLTNDSPLTGLTIINGAGVEGDAATILPIDAIQEFKVLENPPAEYGWKPGALVNVGLKSGTNSIHGTAYAFGRSDAFDARNYFDPAPVNGTCNIIGAQPLAACDKSPVELEQFGATIGGPIKKDKLFYFLGFEEERYTLGNVLVDNVPEATAQAIPDPANSFPDAISALQAASITPAPLSLKLAGCTLGPPISCNGGYFGNNTGSSPTFTNNFPSNFRSDNGLAKIDYHINNNNTLNGMVFISRADITAPEYGAPFSELQPYWITNQVNNPEVFGANWVWTPNSRWVNDARFGFTWMNRETHGLDNTMPATSFGINTGVTNPLVLGMPAILVSGFSFNSLGNFVAWPISFGPTHVFQGVDNVSYLHGNHNFKFGGEIHYNTNTAGRFTRGRGLICFGCGPGIAFPGSTGLEDFMAGDPSFGQVLVGARLLHLSTWQYAGFFEDDWRVTPRLTLNLGVRYEYLTPLREKDNQLGNFDPTAGLVQVGNQISSPYNADHKDFAPRVGLAWDVTGNGTTVVHAGYSIVYDGGLPMFVFMANAGANNATTLGVSAIPTGAKIVTCPPANIVAGACNIVPTPTQGTGTIQYGLVGAGGPPFAAAWQSQPGDGSGTPLFSNTNTAVCGDGLNTPGPPDPGPCSILGVDRNFRTPFVSNWTVGIQHAFTDNLSLNVAYVGNHGSRLPGTRDINQPNLSTGALPFAKFPYLQFINWLSNLYRSNYNGLQVTVTQRVTHGLSFLAGYTYSHSLDGASFNIDMPNPQDNTNPQAEYDSSAFDIRHRFTLSLTYNLPGIKSPGQILQGWQLNSIITVQTGAPWGVVDLGNNISGTSEFQDRWNFTGNAQDFQSNQNSIPYCSGFAATEGGGIDTSGVSCSQTTPAGSVNVPVGNFATACATAAGASNAAVSLINFGCFAQGNSVMTPPQLGTFGTMGRNPFRDSGIRGWDLSITKSWRFRERLTTEFRAELFNVLNHPNFTNPYGASNGFGHNDPSSTGNFGCGCATPDVAAGNPVLGSGGARAMQLGLKLIF
jgi:Carboxypeptidase regulatory-like domain/TonB dependent receptor-like, beta-barrel